MTTDRKALENAVKILGAIRPEGNVEVHSDWLRPVLAAAEAHLATLPKPRMVEVWHVEWAERLTGDDGWRPRLVGPFTQKRMAEGCAGDLAESKLNACIKVTGPHQQEIPEGKP